VERRVVAGQGEKKGSGRGEKRRRGELLSSKKDPHQEGEKRTLLSLYRKPVRLPGESRRTGACSGTARARRPNVGRLTKEEGGLRSQSSLDKKT